MKQLYKCDACGMDNDLSKQPWVFRSESRKPIKITFECKNCGHRFHVTGKEVAEYNLLLAENDI